MPLRKICILLLLDEMLSVYLLSSFVPNYCSGFPGGLAGKESACNEGDLGLIPGLGRSPGEGKGYPF